MNRSFYTRLLYSHANRWNCHDDPVSYVPMRMQIAAEVAGRGAGEYGLQRVAVVIMWIINRDATSGHPVTAGHRSTGPETRPLKTRATRSYVLAFLRNDQNTGERNYSSTAIAPDRATDLSTRRSRTVRRARAGQLSELCKLSSPGFDRDSTGQTMFSFAVSTR